MFRTENALILREVRFKESDRILTALTADAGKLTLAAHGALSKKSRIAAATQQLTYAELTLFEKNGRYSVREGVTKEAFQGLRTDLERLALGSYFAECLEAFSAEDQPDAALLQLGLNSLYALSHDLADPRLIKAAFELRLMCLAGYAPDLEGCAVCGKTEVQEPHLCLESGSICCRDCRKASMGPTERLDEGVLAALRYVVKAPPKQMLSFRLEGKSLDMFSAAAERYLLTQAERGFSALDYWKKLERTMDSVQDKG